MPYKNYVELQKFSLLYQHICFVDSAEHLADGVFAHNQITVRFGAEAVREDSEYRFIFCKIHKRDKTIFLKSMEELKQKMFIMSHADYEDFCIDMFRKLQIDSGSDQ